MLPCGGYPPTSLDQRLRSRLHISSDLFCHSFQVHLDADQVLLLEHQ